jgi:hypothetical protein
MVESDRPRVTFLIRRMRLSCLIIKATGTQSEECVFVAFLLQQWLGERTSVTILRFLFQLF